MKKNIVTLLASAAVLAMLAGCGSSEDGAAPSGVEVESIETAEEAPVKEEVSEETTEEAEDSEETENPIGDGIITVDTIENTENNPWNTIELPEKESEVTS